MVHFPSHFTIQAKKYYILPRKSLKVFHIPIACQSEHRPRYFHLDRINNSFAIHHSSSHMLLTAEKRHGVA